VLLAGRLGVFLIAVRVVDGGVGVPCRGDAGDRHRLVRDLAALWRQISRPVTRLMEQSCRRETCQYQLSNNNFTKNMDSTIGRDVWYSRRARRRWRC
jgi:hypothetical protein